MVANTRKRKKMSEAAPESTAACLDSDEGLPEDGAVQQEHEQTQQADGEVSDSEAGELDDFRSSPDLVAALEVFGERAREATQFLQPSSSISEAARHAAKALCGYMQTSRPKATAAPSAQQQQQHEQQLHVDSAFDVEQIWLQLEMQLAPLLKHARKQMKRLDGEVLQLVPAHVEQQIDAVLQGSSADEGEDDEDEDQEDDDMLLGDDGQHAAGKAAARRPAKKAKLLPVEDRFMRLEDMERFVEQAERDQAGMADDDDADDGNEEGEDGAMFGNGAGPSDDDDEAAFDDLLAGSARLVGRDSKADRGRGQQKGARRPPGIAAVGDESDEEEGGDGGGGDDAMYEDFFGRRDAEGAGEEEEGEEEGEEEEGQEWQGQQEGEVSGEDGFERDPDGGWRARPLLDSDDDGLGEEEEGDGAALGPASSRQKRGAGGRGEEDGEETTLTTHQRRLLRMQERIRELEEAAMGEKAWHMKGEVDASSRPLNSALEMDLDYDTTAKPPPAPTEEATQDLEVLIRRRVADHRFDDVVRVAPPPVEKTKKSVELDDTKAQVGLGELYETEFVRQAAGGVAEDKAEPLRRATRALFKTLCGKLDALSRFHFAPKPVVEELEVRSDVAAVLMEEVAPLAVSKASMQTPKEAYNPEAAGDVRADGELTREERKARRRRKKQAGASKARAAAGAGDKAVAGRKSLRAAQDAGILNKGVPKKHGRTDVGSSSAVFAKIQAQRDIAAAGGATKPSGRKGEGEAGASNAKGSALKL